MAFIDNHLFDEIENGNIAAIGIVYSKLASLDKKTIEISGRIINNYLCKQNTKKILRISEEFKQHSSIDYFIDWQSININEKHALFFDEQDYLSVLKLGTFHCNGYFREKCLRTLMHYDNTLMYAILRLNDWVVPIRKYSYNIILEKLESAPIPELISSLPFISKVEKSQRRNKEHIDLIKLKIYSKITDQISSSDIEKIPKLDYFIRKSFYNFLSSSHFLQKDDLLFLMNKEKNPFCIGLLTDIYLKNYDLPATEVEKLLTNKNSIIRKKALWYKYELTKNYWNGSEEMLFDKCKSIRDDISYIIKKHTDINILKIYIESLKQKEKIKISILGIGENGDSKDSEILFPFLSDDCETIVKNTIISLGKLLEYSGYDLYFKYILDTRRSISKAAYLCAKKNKIYYGGQFLYDAYQNASFDFTKRYILLLLLNEDSWERLPYLIKLYNIEDKALRQKIRFKILVLNPYIKISKEKANYIRKTISEEKLPDDIKKSIEFEMKFSIKE